MDLKTLAHFFNQRMYSIPNYQRGYSWQEENVKALLDDLANAIQLDNSHFTGTITLNRHPTVPEVRVGLSSYQHYHLVDGQQRFTTIILIVAHLIRELKKLAEWKQEATEKEGTYLKKKDQYVLAYEGDVAANQHLRARILELEAATGQESNIYTRNLTKAKEVIAKFFNQPLYCDKLPEFLGAMESRLRFGEYLVENSAQIGVLFETMNNRGVALSTLEIVKNRLLYLITKLSDQDEAGRLEKELNEQWATILRNLTLRSRSLNEDQFLENHWVVYRGHSSRKKVKDQILKEVFTIDQVVKDAPAMAVTIRDYIQSLAEHSLYWRYLHDPSTGFTEVANKSLRRELRDWFERLNRLEMRTIRPVCMAFFPLLNTTRANELVELAKVAELFCFRVLKMNRRRSDTGLNDLWRRANSWHQNVHSSPELPSALFTLAWWIEEYGGLTRFRETIIEEMFLVGSKEGYYSWPGLPYLLYEYEESLQEKASGSTKVRWDFAQKRDSSIEHILPQQPTAAYWTERFGSRNTSQRRRAIHTLGNLVLVSRERNAALQNNPYPRKAKGASDDDRAYCNGSYSEIALARRYKDWTYDTISAREQEILAFMSERWRLNVNLFDMYPAPDGDELVTPSIVDEEGADVSTDADMS